MATVRPISGVGGKGPACFLLETAGARVLLDLGYGPQPGLWPDVTGVGPVDAIVLTHGHADHAGGLKLAAQVGSPPVYATPSVIATLDPALKTYALHPGDTTSVCGVAVRSGWNGHAPGGVWLHAEAGQGLLYTGDYCVESLIYAYEAPPPAATVILDASYGAYDASLEGCIAQLDPMFDSPACLLPVPPRGRGPEIAYHLARARSVLPCLGDDVREAARELALAPAANGVRAEAVGLLHRIADEAPPIGGAHGLMLAGPGDAHNGEAAHWVACFEAQAEPAIVFTGYLPPGTPAQRLTDSGRARYVRWNVHPRLRDNIALVRSTRARTVVPAFGDIRHRARWEEAFAPARVTFDSVVEL